MYTVFIIISLRYNASTGAPARESYEYTNFVYYEFMKHFAANFYDFFLRNDITQCYEGGGRAQKCVYVRFV